ncbi:MAG: hypothetical protein FJW20_18770 [Acidimicrobiia bacterium]|nr:hypothetical protein [Acidimicrobiia bacterium]
MLRLGCALLAAVSLPGADLASFQLPAKTAFPASMPRYPNAWFYVEAALAANYADAVKLVRSNLRSAMRLREYYGPFSNPEGCDSDFRLEHLQPWEDNRHRALQHSHAFHMRYYHSSLEAAKLHEVTMEGKRYYRVAASAHYEVEHTNPNHADVEICPICGLTGEYATLQGNLVEIAHDPLGLELLLTGRIRGEVVRFDDWEQREVGSVLSLRRRFTVGTHVFGGMSEGRNTLRIGIVTLER